MFIKIKKYLDNGGFVTFDVHFNLGGNHAFSVFGYKEISYDEIYVEILNPWREGYYCENNIKNMMVIKIYQMRKRKNLI